MTPQPTALDDPLEDLPASKVLEYGAGQVIYSGPREAALYLVVSGKVHVSLIDSNVGIDVYQADELFGESGLLGTVRKGEEARALETAKVMSWTTEQIKDAMSRRPNLAFALLQMMGKRSLELQERIVVFSQDLAAVRLARTLVRFADKFGTEFNNGEIHMMPMTHALLAQYVGTGREIVSSHMRKFYREGYLRYSRSRITILPTFKPALDLGGNALA